MRKLPQKVDTQKVESLRLNDVSMSIACSGVLAAATRRKNS